MTTTLLITGGTGFVGRQVLKSLENSSFKLRLVLRNEKEKLYSQEQNIDSILVTPDLFAESVSWWEDACQGVDIVIHLAWYTEPSKYLLSPINLDCLRGTLNIAQACILSGVKRFVGIGTCFEYDLSHGYLSVDTPLNPISPYAAAKAATYLMLSQFFAEGKKEFLWCRLFYLYGEGEDERRLVPYLKSKLSAGKVAELTDGNQIRDYLNVAQAGNMIVNAAVGNKIGAINICSGIGISVRELAENIADEYGRRDLLRFGARPNNLVDPPCVVGVVE